jgi:hypothetical protein
MYIKGMMSDNGNKNKKKARNGYVWPTLMMLTLFFIFAQPISVGFSVFVFVMILMLNAYVFLDSDWKVSRKMESKKTFDKIQKCAFCFFMMEFIPSIGYVFYGLTGELGELVVGVLSLIMSVVGLVHSIMIKVDYDCYN